KLRPPERSMFALRMCRAGRAFVRRSGTSPALAMQVARPRVGGGASLGGARHRGQARDGLMAQPADPDTTSTEVACKLFHGMMPVERVVAPTAAMHRARQTNSLIQASDH